MTRHVDLQVDFDDDWQGGDTWLPLGVIAGFVTLRIAGKQIIDYVPYGMNASIISLLRTLEADHLAASAKTEDDAPWPLFFCCGSLWNHCGVVADFTVRRAGDRAVFGDFLRCEVPATTILRVPWSSWVGATERIGRSVLRRCPVDKRGISRRYQKRYGLLRAELKRLLGSDTRGRASNNALQRPVSRVTDLAKEGKVRAARSRH